MVRKLLRNKPSDKDYSQREDLFHTRCKFLEKTCSLIVDSGSCTNCCSTRLVDKLSLPKLPHPKPYKLQWVNSDGGLVVNQLVNIPITIRKYQEKVLCDIIPMEAGHILLERPWQYDNKTLHDGLANKITFLHHGKKITLCPLSPSQLKEDQIKLNKKKEEEEKQKTKVKKRPQKRLKGAKRRL
ncbi:hypothetical protein Fmac_001676 [Flemingia macrophylla]|uniref:Uncharacterized protein n=1 Tax=Flemingia macrophylla TaxID=520843 RepID=A0ABD1NHY8_9FABA